MTDLTEIAKLAERVWPVVARQLRGHPAEVQGAALADLTATWLAGHVVDGDPWETRKLRARLLEEHVRAIKELIPINERIIHG